jgi:heat shock protein HslJ
MSGNYEISESNIMFGPIASTKMFCEDSQEQAFSNMLNEVQSFFFTSRGELVFDLKFDSGSSLFK